jgi:hypothetical protein
LEAADQSSQGLHLESLTLLHLRLVSLKLHDQLAKLAEPELLAILIESELGPRQALLRQTMDRSSFDPEELELS